RGRSSSGIPGVPWGAAIACRMIRTFTWRPPTRIAQPLRRRARAAGVWAGVRAVRNPRSRHRRAPADPGESATQTVRGLRFQEFPVQRARQVLEVLSPAARLGGFRSAPSCGGSGRLLPQPLREDPGVVHFAEDLLRVLELPRGLGRALD